MPDSSLAAIPKRIAPFHHALASGTTTPDGRYCPIYHNDGSLWFIHDLETGEQAFHPPEYGPEIPRHIVLDRIAELERRTARKVYFIGTPDTAIKIGVTCSVSDRFRTIQAHSPVKLEILATRRGGEMLESAYHYQFAEHRLHGEWFEPHPDILAEIERLTK